MVAVEGKDSPTGGWQTEKRNVREDFRRWFGVDVSEIDGVAIMTDTDNSHGCATALYGDIYFSEK